MIGEVIRTIDKEGNCNFGLLIEIKDVSGKVYYPCSDLLWALKRDELINKPLIPQRVEIKFIEE